MPSVIFTDKYSVSGFGETTTGLRVNYTETSYDVATNTTTVTITSIALSSTLSASGPVYGTLKVNGTQIVKFSGGYSNTASPSENYSTVTGFSPTTIEISHNDVGEATMTVSITGGSNGVFGVSYSGKMFGVRTSKSKSVSLTTHPRASTISASDSSVFTQGSYSLAMNRMATTYHHIATFSYNGTTLYTSASFDTSLSFTVPRTWFANYASLDTLPVTVSVQTYNSEDTAIGDPATANLTVTADADMKPVVSTGWAALSPFNVGAVVGITGYVKGYSQAEATFDSTKISMASAVGASIASYSVACQGTTKDTSPYLTPVLVYTSVSVVCTVTDTRGRTASETFTLSVMDYAKPTLTGITISRCTDQGVADEDGDHYSAKATLTYSSLGGQNHPTLTCAVASAGGSYGSEESMTSGTAHVSTAQISADQTYTVRITATDSLGNTAVYYQVLPTRKWAMKFRADGNGVAFGKAAERDATFEITDSWEFRLKGKTINTLIQEVATAIVNAAIAQLPEIDDTHESADGLWSSQKIAAEIAGITPGGGEIESGSDYVKFPDGTLIQWAKVSITAGANATGNTTWTFTEPFVDTDYVATATAATGTQANTRSRVIASSYNTTDIHVYWRNESNSSYTMSVACIAIGRWKAVSA